VLTRREHDALRVAADRARLAPSVHNTQPWRLRLHPDRLELWLDHSRRLPATDPELAALDPVVSLRRSNRTEFTGAAPVEVTDRLGAVAAAEGARLTLLSEPQRQVLARVSEAAPAVRNCDEGYGRELSTWTSRPARERDGIQVEPSWASRSGTGAVPLRDFTFGPVVRPPAADALEDAESLLVLATDRDAPPDWLHAGEALERVLLEVVRLGWQAGLVTQPVEVPATPQQLERLLPGLVPQAVLRVGRGEPPSGTAPRRRTVDVLQDLTAFPRGPGEEITTPVAPADAVRRMAPPEGPDNERTDR
jgi:hypothetical protein